MTRLLYGGCTTFKPLSPLGSNLSQFHQFSNCSVIPLCIKSIRVKRASKETREPKETRASKETLEPKETREPKETTEPLVNVLYR